MGPAPVEGSHERGKIPAPCEPPHWQEIGQDIRGVSESQRRMCSSFV